MPSAVTSAWTNKIRALGYVSGVYSSAGSHIKAMDDARVARPEAFMLPDRIWIARCIPIDCSTSACRCIGSAGAGPWQG